MSYIGNNLENQNYVPAIDYFNGDGSTVAFTLSRPVASVAAVQAVISNVPQNPGSAFTVSGSTITFTSAPPSGTNNIYVYYTSPNTQVVQPGQGTVGTTQLAGGTVVTTADATLNGLTVGKGTGSAARTTTVGQLASNVNTASGTDNTAIGYAALYTNSTGAQNTAVGTQALISNSTANNNTAVGYQAGYSNQTGTRNAYFGTAAGYANTANYNTFVGNHAGDNSTGGWNTFVGDYAGTAMTTGQYNTLIGKFDGNSSGLDIRTLSNYIVLSDGGGIPKFVSDPNGSVGLNAAPSSWASATTTYQTRNISLYGYDVYEGGLQVNAYYNGGWKYISAGTNCAQIQMTGGSVYVKTSGSGSANAGITWTNGPYVSILGTSWTNSSDERLKDITGEIQDALSKVKKLRAAEFTWKNSANTKPQVGLIAQDLLEVLPEVVVIPEKEFDGTAETAYGVNYDNVTALLVAAIKELNAKVEAQAAEIAALKGAA